MCDDFGITPDTFLNCLCVQARFIEIYDSSGSVGTFVEGAALQEIYSILATIRGWLGTWYISLTHCFQKDYSRWGPWCAFHFTKVTVASPHTIQEYQPCHGFYFSKVLNPQPAAPGQDALGLITFYPRPDEPISDPLQPRRPQPLISHHLSVRPQSRLQRRSQPISIQFHRTILKWRSQHIQKNNRITVYPFTHSVTGKPLMW